MTIIDCCISLKMIKKNLVVLGVVDMRQLLLNDYRKYCSGAERVKLASPVSFPPKVNYDPLGNLRGISFCCC